MTKYVVSYSLDYAHEVHVGIEAENEEKALEKAANAFDEGTIWDDTPEMPLLYDEFDEVEGSSLEFNIESAVEAFPKPDASVIQMRRENFARKACEDLVEAFKPENPSDGFSPDLLFEAYQKARLAIGLER
ncbi:hypothetical protein BI364_10020 [Acidihalobacter yilgarnensis]|uniref:Uncharacterized protein n=1 Tax=Acidihalobacter yilgarnensis TaxID=2819280 RepID=A0A1D8IP23_9GAMM|nr:hypothetical protein [Acidihalobacter yilgarnensis]AOU98250.1 hypothetical protein BI364_10020 [Acidihalobacter yilgarnensis]